MVNPPAGGLRVATTGFPQPYVQSLYAPLVGQVEMRPAPDPTEGLESDLSRVDVLHLAWPEYWSGVDPARTQAIIGGVRASGTHILWTQHNLLPHGHKNRAAETCYQLWAEAADAVIHHTQWGRRVALGTYTYGPDTRHAVIAHGHWGHLYDARPASTRAGVEAEERWAPCGVRLAVLGGPRVEKRVQMVIEAVVASGRDDLHLVLRDDDGAVVPDDPRITVERGAVELDRYLRRMAAYDALVLPFLPNGMLTTGVAFDAIGRGIAALTSDWAFFDEVFTGADIRYGSGAAELAACIESLTPERLERSSAAMRSLRPRYEWGPIAAQTLELLQAIAN